MAIYGQVALENAKNNVIDNILLSESTTNIEESYKTNRVGLSLMTEATKDPNFY